MHSFECYIGFISLQNCFPTVEINTYIKHSWVCINSLPLQSIHSSLFIGHHWVNSLVPERFKRNFQVSHFPVNFGHWWLRYLFWNCPPMNVTVPYWSSQHWFREWLGAIRQQAITRANVDPVPCHHILSLGHNGLTYRPVGDMAIIWKVSLLILNSDSNYRIVASALTVKWL